jgi:sugar lactone lactonase YvrE
MTADPVRVVLGEPLLWRDARAVLAESLWWADGHLHWCDIASGTLHRSPASGRVDGADDRVVGFPPPLASFQPRRGGGYVVALEDSVIVCDADGGDRRVVADLPHAHPAMRLNEGKCDPAGRFQIGSMNIEGEDPDAAVYLVSAEGARVVRGGFTTTNGFEWSPQDGTAFLTDTGTETIYRAEWTEVDGPGELHPFAVGRSFDGATLDGEGYLWAGVYGEGAVVRIDPSGEVVLEVDIPAPQVTSVAFGGDDLATLFVATSRENLTEEQLAEYPTSGAIFAIRTSVTGVPVRSFDG